MWTRSLSGSVESREKVKVCQAVAMSDKESLRGRVQLSHFQAKTSTTSLQTTKILLQHFAKRELSPLADSAHGTAIARRKMSIQRCASHPFPSLAWTLSSLALSRGSKSCPRATRRPFTCSLGTRSSSKRKLVTASVSHSSSLDGPFASSPRNAGVPETSVAGSFAPRATMPYPYTPAGNEARLETGTSTGTSIDEATAPKSMTEGEAQQSRPVMKEEEDQEQKEKQMKRKEHTKKEEEEEETKQQTAGEKNPPPPPPTRSPDPSSLRPKRKLRARKAAIALSATAVHQLRRLLAQPDPKLIRVGVQNKGCSGLAYRLEYVDKPGLLDEEVDQEGVKVLIDSKALLSIIGSEMDWVEDKLSQRFVFRNPNIKEQCGCGESFMV